MTQKEAIEKMNAAGGWLLSGYKYTKASGNWSAARRRKLIRCPCGAYYCSDAALAAGLYSESEWARMGYPHFRRTGDGISLYYLDPKSAVRHFRFKSGGVLPGGSVGPFTHVRVGPQPVARIWRAFYEPRSRRREEGIHSVDLFSSEQMDLTRFKLSNKQALALLDGDKDVAKLVEEHRKPKQKRYKPFDPKEAARQYEEEAGFANRNDCSSLGQAARLRLAFPAYFYADAKWRL